MSICNDCENYNVRLTGNIVDGVWESFKEEEICNLGRCVPITDSDGCKDYEEKYNADKYILNLSKTIDLLETKIRVQESEVLFYKCILDDTKAKHDKIINRFSSMLHKTRQKSVKMSAYDYCKMLGENDKVKKELLQKTNAIANLLSIIKTKSDAIFELHSKAKKQKESFENKLIQERMQSDKWQEAFLSLETQGFKRFVIEKIIGKIKGVAK